MNRKTPTGRQTAAEPNIQFLKPPMAPETVEMLRQIREAAEQQIGVRDNVQPLFVGVDVAKVGCDETAMVVRQGTRILLRAGSGGPAIIDRDWISGLNACRKPEREILALAFETIARAHGATVERREEGRHPGWHSGKIGLQIALNGVGAMVDFSNLHGGGHGLIHWYNDYDAGRVTRNFASPFVLAVRAFSSMSGSRPHHKATSGGGDWYALALCLDAGLLLAARGEAFEQPSAS